MKQTRLKKRTLLHAEYADEQLIISDLSFMVDPWSYFSFQSVFQ